MLIVFSGLPGTGKTTLARAVAGLRAVIHIRLDTIEQALRNSGHTVTGEGYAVAYAQAEENLRLGHCVIADCVNPWPLTRAEWHAVAKRAGARVLDVELVCSDVEEHRRRVESRQPDLAGHRVPTWQEVVERDYQPWTSERLVLDTSRMSVDECARIVARHQPPTTNH